MNNHNALFCNMLRHIAELRAWEKCKLRRRRIRQGDGFYGSWLYGGRRRHFDGAWRGFSQFPPCRRPMGADILAIVLSDTPQGAVAPAPPTRSHPASAS